MAPQTHEVNNKQAKLLPLLHVLFFRSPESDSNKFRFKIEYNDSIRH